MVKHNSKLILLATTLVMAPVNSVFADDQLSKPVSDFFSSVVSQITSPPNSGTAVIDVEKEKDALEANFQAYKKAHEKDVPKLDFENCTIKPTSETSPEELTYSGPESGFKKREDSVKQDFWSASNVASGKFAYGLYSTTQKVALPSSSTSRKNDVTGLDGVKDQFRKDYLISTGKGLTIFAVSLNRVELAASDISLDDLLKFLKTEYSIDGANIEYVEGAGSGMRYKFKRTDEPVMNMQWHYRFAQIECKKVKKPFTMEAIENINVPDGTTPAPGTSTAPAKPKAKKPVHQ